MAWARRDAEILKHHFSAAWARQKLTALLHLCTLSIIKLANCCGGYIADAIAATSTSYDYGDDNDDDDDDDDDDIRRRR